MILRKHLHLISSFAVCCDSLHLMIKMLRLYIRFPIYWAFWFAARIQIHLLMAIKSPCHHLFEINEEKCLILKALYQPLLLVIVQTFKKKLHKKNRHIMTLFSFRSGQRDRQKHFSHFPITVSFINAKDEIYYGNKTLWQFEINRNTFSHQKWTH